MSGFTLDTSGAVWCEYRNTDGEVFRADGPYHWPDLSPFEQGYVEAMFAASQDALRIPVAFGTGYTYPPPRFSDLAPETLAAIRKDCAAFQARYAKATTWNSGAQFWRDRSRGFYGVAGNRGRPAFPPLTPILSDDGKVRVAEAADTSDRQRSPGTNQP